MNEIQLISSKIKLLPDRPPFMLDSDLIQIYGTSAKRINEAVKRNPARFPADFVFQLSKQEAESCGYIADENGQFGTRKHRPKSYLPYAFTREGCNMLSAVLNTPVAVARSIQIMRAFSAMERGESVTAQAVNQMLGIVTELSERVKNLESRPAYSINLPSDKALPLVISRKVSRRRHINIVVSPEARKLAIEMLTAGRTYEYVTEELNKIPGFKTSKSAVARFWQAVREGCLKENGIDVVSVTVN